MSEQTRTTPSRRPEAQETAQAAAGAPQTGKTGEQLKAEMDELLDDIDSVLEENAEEFVNAYVQKGGQ